MINLLDQLKARRIKLGFKQHDMMLRVGMSRQQYQRLESKGNPRLDTLELVAKGLKSELLLIPEDKLDAVLALLNKEPAEANFKVCEPSASNNSANQKKTISEDPWQGLLGDDE